MTFETLYIRFNDIKAYNIVIALLEKCIIVNNLEFTTLQQRILAR